MRRLPFRPWSVQVFENVNRPTIVWIAQPRDRGTYYTEITARRAGFEPARDRTAAFLVNEKGRVVFTNLRLTISVSGAGGRSSASRAATRVLRGAP